MACFQKEIAGFLKVESDTPGVGKQMMVLPLLDHRGGGGFRPTQNPGTQRTPQKANFSHWRVALIVFPQKRFPKWHFGSNYVFWVIFFPLSRGVWNQKPLSHSEEEKKRQSPHPGGGGVGHTLSTPKGTGRTPPQLKAVKTPYTNPGSHPGTTYPPPGRNHPPPG